MDYGDKISLALSATIPIVFYRDIKIIKSTHDQKHGIAFVTEKMELISVWRLHLGRMETWTSSR